MIRAEVALSMAEFAENIAALSACDMSKQLSHTLSVLAEVQKRAKELQDLQAREDVSTIMSTGKNLNDLIVLCLFFHSVPVTVDEYARLVNSVRVCCDASCFSRANQQSYSARIYLKSAAVCILA